MIIKKILLSLINFLLLFFNYSSNSVYYVDSLNGNDKNSGSKNAPWKTIRKVNTTEISPGDAVLFIRGGTWKEILEISNYEDGENISIGSYGDDNSEPIIDGELKRTNGIIVRGKNITIEGFTIKNTIGKGGILVKNGNNIVIKRCTFLITGHGGVFIEESRNCKILNSDFLTPDKNSSAQTDGIYSQRNNNLLFEGNKIIITNENPTPHCDGIQSYLDTNVTINNNYIEQRNNKTSNAQGIYTLKAAGTHIYNGNIIKCPNTKSAVIGFRNLETGTGGIKLLNNKLEGIGSNILYLSETTSAEVRNNEFKSTGQSFIVHISSEILTPSKFNNNIFKGNSQKIVDYSGKTLTRAEWQELGFDTESTFEITRSSQTP